ncbi:MAG TPA: mechanosensitive ion channel family protein [Thermoanaerobaculia bacterium]|nr:mechanosensitive ion channel family protein [Thermoanaerobaculia bacterium]
MQLQQAWNLLVQKMTGWMRGFVLLLPNLLIAVLVVVAAWMIARGVRLLLLRLLRRVSHSIQVNRLLAQTVFLGILTAGTFIALGILGLQKTVASLLAGAGIIGLALGFAFQDIAANLMAGIYLAVQRPFHVGHLVKTQDFFGVIQRVHLRWTELRTQQGQIVLIPNKQVFENPILNYSSTGMRRVDLRLGVSYADNLEKVKAVAVRAAEEVSTRDRSREVELYYEEFGESSVDFVVRFWIPFTSKHSDYLHAQSEAIQRIKAAFDAHGITIPFPIRTLDFSAAGGFLGRETEKQ